MDGEIQKLKEQASSQQHDVKNAELRRSEDVKIPELEGDVGKLHKTHNVCSNTAAATSSNLPQKAVYNTISAQNPIYKQNQRVTRSHKVGLTPPQIKYFYTYTRMVVIIIGKFHQWQMVIPSTFKINHTSPQHIFQSFDSKIRLTIGLGMKSHAKHNLGTKTLLKRLPKLRILIRTGNQIFNRTTTFRICKRWQKILEWSKNSLDITPFCSNASKTYVSLHEDGISTSATSSSNEISVSLKQH
ncbi:hypothetical protein R3W88_033660 [Solanum pinnatisectum]|uniref:Uncharacterized protein n=1 Tax=Solanum pinnatisectum TaxID=50273 RepID=A0AAV9K0D6_9SOLN|nr:hypothetical protein R3W88_033660 [Solanum pinnatisectum]